MSTSGWRTKRANPDEPTEMEEAWGVAAEPKAKAAKHDGEQQQSSAKKKEKGGKKKNGLSKKDEIVAKLLLNLEMRMRDLEAKAFEINLVKATGKVPLEMRAYTKDYGKQAIAAKEEGKEIGPPHAQAWMGLWDGLEKEAENLKPETRAELKNWKDKEDKKSLEMIMEQVRVCKITKTYKSDTKKLIIAHTDRTITTFIDTCLKQLGSTKKQGRAPTSAMARLLAAHLDDEEDL